MKPEYKFPSHIVHPKDTFFDAARQEAYRSKYQAVLDTGVEQHRFLEIGVRLGYSAVCLLGAAPNSEYLGLDGMLDEKDPRYALGIDTLGTAAATLKELFPDATINTQLIDTQVPGAYARAGEPKGYTFIHVDGDHSAEGALRDLEFALLAAAPGATILVDDTNWREVMMAVTKFLTTHENVTIFRTYKGHNGEIAIRVI
jgi:predicted O-methyltransferase YrrM